MTIIMINNLITNCIIASLLYRVGKNLVVFMFGLLAMVDLMVTCVHVMDMLLAFIQ